MKANFEMQPDGTYELHVLGNVGGRIIPCSRGVQFVAALGSRVQRDTNWQ